MTPAFTAGSRRHPALRSGPPAHTPMPTPPGARRPVVGRLLEGRRCAGPGPDDYRWSGPVKEWRGDATGAGWVRRAGA
ncbi:unnamed protein product [[Actinomadura] parvosata subsp. kistnae]|nr:unnamed protein product [Actinomadura parvosata subsp. kistnae]